MWDNIMQLVFYTYLDFVYMSWKVAKCMLFQIQLILYMHLSKFTIPSRQPVFVKGFAYIVSGVLLTGIVSSYYI